MFFISEITEIMIQIMNQKSLVIDPIEDESLSFKM